MKTNVMKQDDQLGKMTKDALATLCESLENGKSEGILNYLDLISKFPNYSFRNLLLILAQKPKASFVMGYKSWQELDRQVKKGEKAIKIWAPMRLARKDQGESIASREVSSTESKAHLIFRPVNVFDFSQTEGKPLAEFARVSGEPKEYLQALKCFADKEKILVSYSNDISAEGVSKCGEIVLRADLDPANEFHVLAHEIAHELIHTLEKRRELSKTQKEAEAEAVSYVVCKSIGLVTGTASSDYIQLYNGDKETVINSLDVIQKTAARIIKEILV